MMRLFFMIGIVLLSFSSYADVNSDLNHFFDGLGYYSNATTPTAYQGQQAGYYSGGSLYLRNSVRNVQIAQVDLPQINAGCGGIDLYTGGFSFVNGQGIKDLIQNIMHGATGYVAELALEQAIPQATNVMRHMQDVANKINQFNINSCHAASQLVGAMGLRTQESQMQVCESAAISLGKVANWSDAEQYCRNPGNYQTVMNQASQNNQYKYMVVNNTNVAWKAMQSNSFLSTDIELAQLMMTLSGSIIVKDGQSKYLPSHVEDKNLIKGLLRGGSAPVYRCDTTDSSGCLNPIISQINITQNAALETHVVNLLQDMVTKVETDQPLTKEEIGFLQSTRLPVYKMLNVQSAYMGDQSILDVTGYADVIATDILYQYLEESLNEVKTASSAMQYPPSVMKPFMEGINQALASVRDQELSAYRKIQTVNSLVERTQIAEQMLAGQLSSQLYDNLKWASGTH